MTSSMQEAEEKHLKLHFPLRISPSAAGLLAFSLPILWDLSKESWRKEDGVQGVFVLATAGWLFARNWNTLKGIDQPKTFYFPSILLTLALGLLLAGRSTDYLTLEALAGVFAAIALFTARFGVLLLKIFWFPFTYLCFAIPPPGYLMSAWTIPLKKIASSIATTVLSACGLPISHEGVTITVAQYQLLVEDACSGMNSIIGLVGVCLLYVYLSRGGRPFYAIFLRQEP